MSYGVVAVVPGEPRRIRADVVNSTAIRVQWRTPDTSQNSDHTQSSTLSGVIRGYRVYVSVDGADPSTPPAAPRDVANAEATEMIVGGLVPDTTYLVHATAYTRRADGHPSRTVKVRTKGAGIFSTFLHFYASATFRRCRRRYVFMSSVRPCVRPSVILFPQYRWYAVTH